MTKKQQAHALQIAMHLRSRAQIASTPGNLDTLSASAANELERQHARIAELEQRLEIDPRHRYDGISARDATIEAQDERIEDLESQLAAIGAGGVEPLRKQVAAPQAVQAAVPLFWVLLLRDGLYEGPVHNNSVGGKMLREEKPGEWHPLYLHTAPAHPAEGVPAQDVEIKVSAVMLKVAALIEKRVEVEPCAEAEAELLKFLRAAFAATQPAAQGMDARTSIGTLWVEENGANDLELCPCAAPKLATQT